MPTLTEFMGLTKSKIKRNRTSVNSKAPDVILLSDEEDSPATSKASLKKQLPAPAKKTIGKGGRPSDSSVWNYFNYDKEVDKCTCRNCLKEIDGFHQQNAKIHLKHHHPDDFVK
ncbi:hypothetical protein BV898_06608 [Hypsibius exemplaris]|uniref:BED-type domain-containing protein n=1 Tax=Hypsibius exemplaris TaxID=2072580 RepID=A0A1W0WW10_HYPEX|nr:hypothetical protein BV898_06608 [Hypsibius exemplaris]